MKVSVVIPAINESRLIARAVNSAQQAGAEEVIVVDGGSTDGTPDIAAGLGCQILTSPLGRAVQQNCGARRASGDVLLFLHADSVLPRESLAQVRSALSKPDVAGGAFQHRIDANGFLFRLIEQGNALRVRCFGMAYGDQGIFLRRELFDDVGGFPTARLMEDVMLIRKLRARGRIALLPGPLKTSARRWQQHGIVRQILRNWTILVAEQLGASPDYLASFYRPCPAASSESPKEC